MKLLIQNVLVRDGGEQKSATDIEVVNGHISQIGKVNPSKDHKIITADGLECSVGFFDPFVNFCEPGLEYKEDFESGIKAASFGGFSHVAVVPDTVPLISNRPQLDFIKASTVNKTTTVSALPSFIKENSENELSEIVELSEAGALAFLQPHKRVVNASVLLKALEYVKIIDKKIVVYATDFNIVPGAFIHEGNTNVKIGMRGIPDFSEELLVKQYVELLRYTNSALHISGVSSARSLRCIKEAKEEGLNISADTSIYNLIFSENELLDFDTNYKLNPPLRSLEDKLALIEAVKSGLIDAVTSKHAPQHEDDKKTEMKMAEFGVIGLQTMFSAMLQVFTMDETISILTKRNRSIFKVEVPKIEIDEIANFSLFSPNQKWTYDLKNNLSKSENSMFLGKELFGKTVGVINGAHYNLNGID